MQSLRKTQNSDITGQNVFIEFQIVKNSNPISLTKELDILIARGKKIYVWSKTVPVEEMEKYCSSIIIPTPEDEKLIHWKVYILRYKHKKTYKEISDLLNIPISKVSYYAQANPNREWKLNDWIAGYHVKDNTLYDKVDYLVDCDESIVNRFKKAGRPATLIKEVK